MFKDPFETFTDPNGRVFGQRVKPRGTDPHGVPIVEFVGKPVLVRDPNYKPDWSGSRTPASRASDVALSNQLGGVVLVTAAGMCFGIGFLFADAIARIF